MSGLVAWSSRAKRKPLAKQGGAKPNAHNLRASAAKQRKLNARINKDAEKARKEKTAAAVAAMNA